jgi:hypothetical protein
VSRASLISLLCLLAPAQALAQQPAAPPDAKQRAILVLQLDDEADVMTRGVAQALGEEGFAVWDRAEIERALSPVVIPAPTREAMQPFVGLDGQLNEGVRSFFYLGEQGAIDRLREPVALGLRSAEVLIHRPDWAGQIIDGGVVLVRAYAEGGKKTRKEASALAEQLARTFPSYVATAELVPPETLKVFEEARTRALEGRATLSFEGAERPGCRVYLNGAPVTTTSLPVAADTPYAVRQECGAGAPFAFRVTVPAGKTRAVTLVDTDPLALAMPDDELSTRAKVERSMRFLSAVTGVPSAIGVSRARGQAATPQERYLFVRVEQGAGAVWSDGTDPVTMRELLVRVLPELDTAAIDRMVRARQPAPSAQQADEGGMGAKGWLGVGGLVLGAGALGASAYFNAEAGDLGDQMASPQPSRAAYDALDDDRTSAQTSGQIALYAGGGLIALGAGLLLWELLGGEDTAVTIIPSAGAESASVDLLWSF